MQHSKNNGPKPPYYLSVKKINAEVGGVLAAAMHNKRDLPDAPHIIKSRSHKNYDLHSSKTSSEIAIYATAEMIKAKIINPRSNLVLAVEILFSLPAHWLHRDNSAFFMACYQWTKENLAGELLSFDVHLDESSPHAHALILPLINGKMQGSDLVGGPGKINRLHKSFYDNVASHYGLSKAGSKHKSQSNKLNVAAKVIRALRKDEIRRSKIWEWFRKEISNNPYSCAGFLGIDI